MTDCNFLQPLPPTGSRPLPGCHLTVPPTTSSTAPSARLFLLVARLRSLFQPALWDFLRRAQSILAVPRWFLSHAASQSLAAGPAARPLSRLSNSTRARIPLPCKRPSCPCPGLSVSTRLSSPARIQCSASRSLEPLSWTTSPTSSRLSREPQQLKNSAEHENMRSHELDQGCFSWYPLEMLAQDCTQEEALSSEQESAWLQVAQEIILF